jgi:hypothetical protein
MRILHDGGHRYRGLRAIAKFLLQGLDLSRYLYNGTSGRQSFSGLRQLTFHDLWFAS